MDVEQFESLDHLQSVLDEVAGSGFNRMEATFHNKYDPESRSKSYTFFIDELVWDLQRCLEIARRYQSLLCFVKDASEAMKG